MTNFFPRIVVIGLALLFCNSCMIAQDKEATTPEEPTYYGGDAGKKLDWAMFYLRKHYVDSTDNDRLAEVALRSILNELDPFSYYQSREALEKQQKADKGLQEEGIGISMYPVAGKAMLTDVILGGAADKAGLKRGDFILKVNGENMIGQRLDTIANKIKGPDGTIVKIAYERNKGQKEITITRGPVPLHSVDAYQMLTDNIGYIKIGRFNVLTVDEFKDAFLQLKKEGLTSLVLDLRDNLGGLVNAAVGLSDEFLSGKKLVIFTHSHNTEREEYYTEKEGVFEEGKVVILVNQSTASASEIFTAAMQDWDRALVLGQSSYGKGLIQQSYLLGDGSAMRITIGRYYTPAGRNVQGPYFANADWLQPYLKDLPANGYTTLLPIPAEKKFTTRNNRSLFTNQGGITPDIYVAPTTDTYYNQLNNMGLLFGFATNYSNEQRQQLNSRFSNGLAFDESQEINQEIATFFLEYAQKEIQQNGYAITLQPTVSKNMLLNLKAWIGAQVWDNDVYYTIYNDIDPVVQRALSSIKDGSFRVLKIEN